MEKYSAMLRQQSHKPLFCGHYSSATFIYFFLFLRLEKIVYSSSNSSLLSKWWFSATINWLSAVAHKPLKDFWIIFGEILCHASTTKSQTSFIAGTIRVRPLLLFFSKKLRALIECGLYSSATYNQRNRVDTSMCRYQQKSNLLHE